MAKAQVIDLKHETKDNDSFRRVVFTGTTSQLVVMSIEPGEDIGLETHDTVDQLIYVVDGEGEAVVDGDRHPFEKGSMICVPAGTAHNIVNTDDEPLKLFTVYAPPAHAPDTEHRTRADAIAAGRHEDLAPV